MSEPIYLVDLDDVKEALKVEGTSEDDRIQSAIADVTAEALAAMGRSSLSYGDESEQPRFYGGVIDTFRLRRRLPILSVSALYLSSSIPRVYGDATKLVEGTDFIIEDAERGWVTLFEPRIISPSFGCVKVQYIGGYESSDEVPGALRSVAKEVVSAKWTKRRFKQYHLTSTVSPEGRVEGIKWDDWSPQQLLVLARHAGGGAVGIG